MEKIFFDTYESLARTVIIGIFAYIGLIAMLRISGKRTLSQLKEFDFIVTVALGSTLATVLLSKDVALADGLIALALLIILQYVIAVLSVRSKRFSKLISSEPTLLFYEGRFMQNAMKQERVTEGEVRSVLRSRGLGDIKTVKAVIMEANGQLSVLETGELNDPDSSLFNVRTTKPVK